MEKSGIRQWLRRRLRVELSDGRAVIGRLMCTDREPNIVLSGARQFWMDEEEKGTTQRLIGLAMVPAKHVTRIILLSDTPSSNRVLTRQSLRGEQRFKVSLLYIIGKGKERMAQFPGQRMGLGAERKGKKRKKTRTDPSDKLPLMVLNEKWPKMEMSIEPMMDKKQPWFHCSVELDGRRFDGEGVSKKMAKQMMAEKCLTELGVPFRALPPPSCPPSTRKEEEDGPILAGSLLELFQKHCKRRQSMDKISYTPEFKIDDVSEPDSKAHEKRLRCTLLLPDQGKVYTVEGSSGKPVLKNVVIKQALLDMFNVDPEQVSLTERRGLRFSSQDPIMMARQAAHQYNYNFELHVEAEDVTSMAPQKKNHPSFRATVTIGDRKFDSVQKSKALAKESACIKALDEAFGVHAEPCTNRNKATSADPSPLTAPAMMLHQLLRTQGGAMAEQSVVYQFIKEYKNEKGQPIFEMRAVVGTQEFIAAGSSKQMAKSRVAMKALRAIFKEDRDGSCLDESAKRRREDNEWAAELARFVQAKYLAVCNRHRAIPAFDLAAFVLRESSSGRMRLVSFASSGCDGGFGGGEPSNILQAGTYLLDQTPCVLARRALMLFLLRDLAQSNSKDMETTTTPTTMTITDESSVLEPSPNGLYRLRPGLTLHLYCQTPPNTGPLLDDANGKSIQVLSCVRDGAFLPSPSNQQSITEMCHYPAIMSLADKILKWNTLGVQGALLSTRMEPIFISSLAMGTLCDIEAVRHAVLERLPTTRSVEVAAVSAPMAARDPGVHCWSRNGDLFENLVAGRTTIGGCSRLSKAALFEMFHSIASIELEQLEKYRTAKELEQYRTAKESAMIYGEGARQFRDELKRRGFGIWQTKPIAVDEFQMSSSDG